MVRAIGFLISYWLTCVVAALLFFVLEVAQAFPDRGWGHQLAVLPVWLLLGPMWVMPVAAPGFLLVRGLLVAMGADHWVLFAMGGAVLGSGLWMVVRITEDLLWATVAIGAIAGAVYRWLELRLVLHRLGEDSGA